MSLSEWFASVDRGFAFLLILPFVVALVGLWASYVRGDDDDDDAVPPRGGPE
jgi:hypothetical protein